MEIVDNRAVDPKLSVGQHFYPPNKLQAHCKVYVLAQFPYASGPISQYTYALVDVDTGYCYLSPSSNIEDVFGNDREEFVRVEIDTLTIK